MAAQASAKASLLATRFPGAHARFTTFKSTRTYSGASWIWLNKRRIVAGLSLSYVALWYYKLRLKAIERDTVHPNTYLIWKFYPGSIVETREATPILQLLSRPNPGEDRPRAITMLEAIQSLRAAAHDDSIRGIYGDFSTFNRPSSIQPEALGLAQIEELISAIHYFKTVKAQQFPLEYSQPTAITTQDGTGQQQHPPELRDTQHIPYTIAFADTFESQSAYLLASAFDKVFLQPSGNVPLTGVSNTVPFLSRLLEKVGIKINATARREYKSMISTATQEDSLTKPQLQDQAQLLGELNRNVAYAIGSHRFPSQDAETAADKIAHIMTNGPYTAKEAKELGLIDELAYKDDVFHVINGGKDADLLHNIQQASEADQPHFTNQDRMHFKTMPHWVSLVERAQRAFHSDDVMDIAICYLSGTISNSPGQFSASAVVNGLREASLDKKIKAIILRIDSGGGDVVASDSLWNAIQRAQQSSGKPVIVSFSNVAASGAYYAASAASAILASESTITGSIGVASIRPTLTRKLFDHAGIALQSFFTGTKEDSLLCEPDPSQKQRREANIDNAYDDFLQKVMQGRGISPEVIHEVAGGRVFTGLTAWSKTLPSTPDMEQLLNLKRTHVLSTPHMTAEDIVRNAEYALGLPATYGGTIFRSPLRSQHQDVIGAISPGTSAEWDLMDCSDLTAEFGAKRIVMKTARRSEDNQVAPPPDGSLQGIANRVVGVDAFERASHKFDAAARSSIGDVSALDVPPTSLDAAQAVPLEEGKLEDGHPVTQRDLASTKHALGLVDVIGGLREAVEAAIAASLWRELRDLGIKANLRGGNDSAQLVLRPNNSFGREEKIFGGSLPYGVLPRLHRYPRQKSYRGLFEDWTSSASDMPVSAALSMAFTGLWDSVKEELSTVMAQAIVKAFALTAADPVSALKQLQQNVENVAAQRGGGGGGVGATRTSMEYEGGRPM